MSKFYDEIKRKILSLEIKAEMRNERKYLVEIKNKFASFIEHFNHFRIQLACNS